MGLRNSVSVGVVSATRRAISDENPIPRIQTDASNREREILQLLAEGASNKDVANVLNLSPTTVICHRQHIVQKLNLHSLADLILYAVRKGVIPSQRSGAMQA